MVKPKNIFKNMFTLFKLSAICVQTSRRYSVLSDSILKVFSFITMITLNLNILLLLYLVVFLLESIKDPGYSAVLISLHANASFLTVHFYLKRQTFDAVIKQFDTALIVL